MTTHRIQLNWDTQTQQVTVTYNNIEAGDQVLFFSNQGQAVVTFPNGNPFSTSNDSLTIDDGLPRSVIQTVGGPFAFNCGVQTAPGAVNTGGGGEVPHPHKS